MAYTRSNMPTYGYDFGREEQQQYDGPVDWREVDAELAQVPAEFKDPRFDSLRQAANMKILKVGQMDTGERLKEASSSERCSWGPCAYMVKVYSKMARSCIGH